MFITRVNKGKGDVTAPLFCTCTSMNWLLAMGQGTGTERRKRQDLVTGETY